MDFINDGEPHIQAVYQKREPTTNMVPYRGHQSSIHIGTSWVHQKNIRKKGRFAT